MGMTLAEKIIARASGRTRVSPGEIVTCNVDLAMMHDSGGPRRVKPILDRLGVGVWDPEKIVLITDHYVPATDQESRQIQDVTRTFASAQKIVRFHDQEGICHVVLPERGHLKPGMFVVGGDSHSPTGGAFGAYMFGVGATEMAGVLATGEIWLKVPETILIEWTGLLGRGLSSKDIMLFLCGRLGMDGGRYQAVQFSGEAVRALPMQERMTLSNMAAELGAQTGLIEADATTFDFLQKAGACVDGTTAWRGDADARPAEHHVFDANLLAPQVAAPHSPANAAPVGDHAGVKVDVAYVGACTEIGRAHV
jgi:3-isopropylmalate/(R)-2-methylmalate dehydratase large subunit